MSILEAGLAYYSVSGLRLKVATTSGFLKIKTNFYA
jgi:hypothetical protein